MTHTMPRPRYGRATASITIFEVHVGGWTYQVKYHTNVEGGTLNRATYARSELQALVDAIARLKGTCERIARETGSRNAGDAYEILNWVQTLNQPALFEATK